MANIIVAGELYESITGQLLRLVVNFDNRMDIR